jgi:glycosyltransferase involved in cell wall biosynthesis
VDLSVLIPAHNPRAEFIGRVLAALRAQTLPLCQWELLLIDNASTPAVTVDLSWHPRARIVREPVLGLTAARLAGFSAAQGDWLVLVDDDNVLAPDYLGQILALTAAHPRLGSGSGCVRLEFQPGAIPPPPAWRGFLAERTCTTPQISRDPGHNGSTPWGAGMFIRREVAEAYAHHARNDPRRLQLDLQGGQLVYGGDTDIAFTGCDLGFDKGVFPQLQLDHLIPASRCTREYLIRAAEGHGYSEILHALLRDGHFPKQRTAWREWLARLRLPRVERIIAAARARGLARARRELAPG